MGNAFSPTTFFDITAFAHNGVFKNCEYVWQALSNIEVYLRELKLGVLETQIPEGTFLANSETISIGEGTVIEPGVFIKGPCIIGKNCQIRQGAYFRGNVIIGDNCVVGHTTELKHSILLNHAKAAHFAFIGDSIIGNDVNLGAGVKCANLRLDGTPIMVREKDSVLPTGLRKFGAIIGDLCQIGCNVVLNPGTIFGKESRCFPCLTVSGVIGDRKLVKPATKQVIIEDL
jgi:UDP-N-acetylglucosamine diphosphorylase / glucose-1-phosphate thymidylyltransferase / UDP-N-acetylgalactosamine diphosphorylase / glucosamine-1-phosphate N-acetyltransferase / galactosamine-1-phosphate N-acetyltransferase